MTATLPELLHRTHSPAGLARLHRPARRHSLPAGCLAFYFGQGLASPAALLYLAGPVHLSVGAVGGCMTAAGVLGLLAAVPAGRVCDRGRPQLVMAAAIAVIAAAALAYLVVRTVPEALAVACVYSAACQSAYTSRAALAARVAPKDPAKLNAGLYRIGNIGFALATPVTGIAASCGTATAYRLALLGSAAAFALAAALIGLVHTAARPTGSTGAPSSRGVAARPWRDLRYLALTCLYALTCLQFIVTEFALPLWVVGHTRAPHAMVGAAALISTVLVVLCQPFASRRASGVRRAAWAMAVSGIAAAAGCLALAGAAGHSAPGAAVLVALGALALAAAEVGQAVGSISLSYRLAPDTATGTYQGFFNIGWGVAVAAGPLVLARTVLRPGVGWPGIALLIALAGLLVPAVVRAGRTRTVNYLPAEPGGRG
jgi:MFS family permease